MCNWTPYCTYFLTGVPFPKNFLTIAKTILKRLFRVYAHIYHQHFSEIVQLGEEAHLNTSFKHFIFFVQEFSLIDKRELAPLQELIEKLASKDKDKDSNPNHWEIFKFYCSFIWLASYPCKIINQELQHRFNAIFSIW